ncbi:MAG: hypothetical protein ABIK62_06090 [candidate division WOR-3 bacterium]
MRAIVSATRTAVLVVVLGSATPATGRLLTLEPLGSLGELARITLMLCDSAECDTSVCCDAQGIAHRVYSDSGRIIYQSQESDLRTSDTDWSAGIPLSRGQNASSPVIVEVRAPGMDATLFVAWREQVEDRIEVFRSYRVPALFPPCWTAPRNVTPW